MRVTRLLAVLAASVALAAGGRTACADDPGGGVAPVASLAAPRGAGAAPSEGKPATANVDFDPASLLSGDPDHLLRHSYFDERFWFSGQLNLIFEGHPGFSARYSGTNSLRKEREEKLSELATLFFAIRLFNNTEILCAAENAGGKAMSDALGIADFSDLDAVRNPSLGAEPYLGRLVLHQTIPLSDELVDNPAQGPFSLPSKVAARRLELRVGRLSLPDFFDANGPGSDSHFQFVGWGTAQNGAWDYAADTRGYTYAAVVEYQDELFAARFAAATMPRVANGIDMDWRLDQASAENLELELHGRDLGDRRGVLRLLGYTNNARMGNYDRSLRRYFEGVDPVPDIVSTRRARSTKYGVGLNAEQEITETLRLFARAGWNDGRNESFAYTEIDNTLEAGFDLRGDLWARERDRVGLAFVSSGLSTGHRRYLANGGLGFLLGDGALRYARETVIEGYYTVKLPLGISMGPLFQEVWNPGYNRDRGPAFVYGFRFHLEI